MGDKLVLGELENAPYQTAILALVHEGKAKHIPSTTELKNVTSTCTGTICARKSDYPL